MKVIPVILSLAGLTLMIAWISGVFTEKIPLVRNSVLLVDFVHYVQPV